MGRSAAPSHSMQPCGMCIAAASLLDTPPWLHTKTYSSHINRLLSRRKQEESNIDIDQEESNTIKTSARVI